jgi:hypothetical protein
LVSRILQVVIWMTAAILALGTVVTILVVAAPSMFESVNLSIPIGFELQGKAGTLEIGSDSIPIEVSHAVGYFTLRGSSSGMVAIVWTFVGIGTAVAILAEIYLRRLVDSAARGEPFERGNALRMRRLGWMAIVMGVLRGLYLLATYLYTVNRMESGIIEASVQFDLGLGFIVAGVVLLALGEVFNRGEALQTDHDLTV